MILLQTILADVKTIHRRMKEDGVRSTARLLHSREAPASAQFVKYGICGVGAVVVHHLVLAILAFTILPVVAPSGLSAEIREQNTILANLIAWPFSNLFAYGMNILWVFTPGRHSKWYEFTLFTLNSFFSFGAGLLGGPVLISEGVPFWLAQGGFVFTSALVNFVCRKFLIFLK